MHIRKAILFNSKWLYLWADHVQLKYLFKAKQEDIGMLQHYVSVKLVIIDFQFRGKTKSKINKWVTSASYNMAEPPLRVLFRGFEFSFASENADVYKQLTKSVVFGEFLGQEKFRSLSASWFGSYKHISVTSILLHLSFHIPQRHERKILEL